VFAVVRQAIDRESKTKTVNDPPRRRRTKDADVLPAGLAPIIDKCLAQKPEDRYTCAGEVADALEAFLASPPPPPRRSSIKLVGAVLGGLAVICGIAAILLSAGEHDGSSQETPNPRQGYVNPSGIEMVWISPGEADLGTPPGDYPRMSDEMIRHVKFERGFYLATAELSVAMYRQVMGNVPAEVSGDENLPITWVSWNDAEEFCNRLSRQSKRHYRLPTEDEWEYAARAGQTTAYPWYIEDPAGGRWPLLSRYANFADSTSKTDHSDQRYSDGSPTLALSRAFQPNRLGLYSMIGNVWEWTGSAYNESSHSRLAPTTDRRLHYVTKGGSWYDDALTFRFGNRNPLAADFRGGNVGFRVVCEEKE
jgi:formylglycine-generating enzyme required for sulfatase activity